MKDLTENTILVVDDTVTNVNILVEALSGTYEVAVATNGPSALRIAEASLPDIILLDIAMPGMDGYEVCRRLKSQERTKDIPVIFLTGMFPARKESEDFRMVAEHLLFDKPYETLELINVIENVLLEKQISLK